MFKGRFSARASEIPTQPMTTKSTKGRIAFFRPRQTPVASVILPDLLRVRFPDHQIDVFDVYQRVKDRKALMLLNSLNTLTEYGPNAVLDGKGTARESFFGTTYLYRHIKQMAKELAPVDKYDFTFQMQSLFDASVDGLPNFVYTDHVHLANLTYPMFDKSKLRPQKWIDMETTIYQRAEKTFTWSTNISKVLTQDYKIDPSQVAWAGVGVNAKIDNIQMDNDDYSNKNILFVGMDWVRKGGPELLEAFKKVLEVHPDAKLTIVGASPETDIPNVNAVGRVPVEQVNSYFEQASVFCLPTKREPFGVVFVEAMHHRLPIVATDIGALPDMVEVGQNGYLVECVDVDMLAKYLSDLIGDPAKCKAFGEHGYQVAAEKYTWDKVADRIAAEIKGVLAAKGVILS
jgi:glycosyltransferase involved in cell wall biosynthesis